LGFNADTINQPLDVRDILILGLHSALAGARSGFGLGNLYAPLSIVQGMASTSQLPLVMSQQGLPTPSIATLLPTQNLLFGLEELFDALEEHTKGNEAPFWAWVKWRMRLRPDRIRLARLQSWISREGRNLDIRALLDFVLGSKALLERKSDPNNDHKSISVRTSELRQGIKKFPSIDISLKALALDGQTSDEVLEEMIPGIAWVEQEELPPGGNLAGKIASEIRREGLKRPDKPGKVYTSFKELDA
jgi:hypothetical protein